MRDYIHSVPSHAVVLAEFINKTKDMVSLEWLDWDGKHVVYHCLEPDEHHCMNTYVGHPWVVYEKDFRHEKVFMVRNLDKFKDLPKTIRKRKPVLRSVYFPGPRSTPLSLKNQKFYKVHILTPMKTLEDICLQYLHKKDIDQDDLPRLGIANEHLKSKLFWLIFMENNQNEKILSAAVPDLDPDEIIDSDDDAPSACSSLSSVKSDSTAKKSKAKSCNIL